MDAMQVFVDEKYKVIFTVFFVVKFFPRCSLRTRFICDGRAVALLIIEHRIIPLVITSRALVIVTKYGFCDFENTVVFVLVKIYLRRTPNQIIRLIWSFSFSIVFAFTAVLA